MKKYLTPNLTIHPTFFTDENGNRVQIDEYDVYIRQGDSIQWDQNKQVPADPKFFSQYEPQIIDLNLLGLSQNQNRYLGLFGPKVKALRITLNPDLDNEKLINRFHQLEFLTLRIENSDHPENIKKLLGQISQLTNLSFLVLNQASENNGPEPFEFLSNKLNLFEFLSQLSGLETLFYHEKSVFYLPETFVEEISKMKNLNTLVFMGMNIYPFPRILSQRLKKLESLIIQANQTDFTFLDQIKYFENLLGLIIGKSDNFIIPAEKLKREVLSLTQLPRLLYLEVEDLDKNSTNEVKKIMKTKRIKYFDEMDDLIEESFPISVQKKIKSLVKIDY